MKKAAALTLFLLLPASAAQASNVVYVCGKNLCATTPAGAKPKVLTRDGARGGAYRRPSLSRSGKRIAFLRGERGRVFTARVKRRRGRIVGIRARRRIAPFRDGARDATQFDVAISPNGRRVAWVELRINVVFPGTVDYRRYTARVDGGDSRQVASNGGRPFVAWFDSTRIMREGLTDAIDEMQTGEDVDQGICVPAPVSEQNGACGADGGIQTAFDPSGRHLRHPRRSPNGRLLVATAYPFGDGIDSSVETPGAIALFDARTASPLRDLTAGPADTQPEFSPDGRSVIFQRGTAIFRVPVRGGKAKRVRRRAAEPTWSR